MISVLICSNNPDLFNNVHGNIIKTIGVCFEILYFDNREGKKGICQVYNELAEKARFPYLCFLHEDVILKTENWGKKIADIFIADSSVGLIGIAGCKYKSGYFSGWFSNVKELDCACYIHQYENGLEKVHLSPLDNDDLQQVVCIDGVFMCCKREVWEKFRFDDEFLKGFHFYDIDFSLRIAHCYKVLVTYELELIHITSGGDYGNNWVKTAMAYHQKMKSTLPYSKIEVNNNIADKKTIIATMDFLKNYKIALENKVKWVLLQKLYLSPVYYYSILKFFLFRLTKLKGNRNK